MSLLPLTLEILITFTLSTFLLYRYGNWLNQHILTTVSVFIAWFFSFIVIFILPLDISTTVHRQCLKDHNQTYLFSDYGIRELSVVTEKSMIIHDNDSHPFPLHIATEAPHNATKLIELTNATHIHEYVKCEIPWSFVPKKVLPTLWRVVYWTSQVLTWLMLPLMQSYSMAGDFTFRGKLKSAFVENAIYYGIFSAIFIILLIYVSLKVGLDFEGLKIICITASNTWGLFLLVVLLGYGLVEIPRSCFNTSQYGRTLSYLYFKVAKLSAEKCESDEKLEDVLEEIQNAYESLSGIYDPMRTYIEVILEKCPNEWREQLLMRSQNNQTNAYRPERGISGGNAFTEKSFIRMHQSIIRAMQSNHRTHCQWDLLIRKAIEWEDVAKNEISPSRIYKSTINERDRSVLANFVRDTIYTPTMEWYWKCMFRGSFYRILGFVLAVFSLLVVWSEMTFSIVHPPLSIFALMMQLSRINYHYLFIEFFSVISIAYLCICSYYTVFKVRVFNYYYLAPHHQTDEYSLIFCGMLLCRLTPPLCLNFLGLIHLDSHITHKVGIVETSFTQIMGHMDVISFVSDSLSIYLPICICLFCLATFFQFGSKLLHNLGFEQFILNDELTAELIREGQELVKREKNKRFRQDNDLQRDWRQMKRDHQTDTQQIMSSNHTITSRTSSDDVRQELLNEVEPIDYSATWNFDSNVRPQKGLFDDV